MGKIQKVVFDTNVIASAFAWGGKPDQAVRFLSSGKLNNFTSPILFDELEGMLEYPKLGFSEEERGEVLNFVLKHSTVVYPEIPVSILPNNNPDNRVLECALEARVGCIVTGDKLLQSLHLWSGIHILSPAKFLESSFVG